MKKLFLVTLAGIFLNMVVIAAELPVFNLEIKKGAKGVELKSGNLKGEAHDVEVSSTRKGQPFLVFNGKTSYVKFPDSPKFDFTKGFTLSCWIKPTKDQPDYTTIIAKREGTVSDFQ